jgi:formate dehydrogenase subunit gamma
MTQTANNPAANKIYIRDKKIIFMHWFNAACWFLLTPSGLGIISGESIRILPAGWSVFMQNLVGGNANLVLMHSIVGIVWSAVFLIYSILNWNNIVLPFLKNVLILTPMKIMDGVWTTAVVLTKLIIPWKVQDEAPPAGRYNGAQRLQATLVVTCSVVLTITGLIMFFGPGVSVAPALFRWSLVIHASCVGAVWVGLLAHIYFALIEERESMEGMKSGYLETAYIKHHSPLWYEELKQQGEIK